MRDLPQPNPRFTGIFIPAEILSIPELNPSDIMLLAWIDALYAEEYGGCFASNAYFCQKMKMQERNVSQIISKLKDLGLIEQVSYDGRIRVLKACKEKPKEAPTQCYSDLRLNASLTCEGVLVRPAKECYSLINKNKEENKAYNTQGTPQENADKSASVRALHGSHVRLSPPEKEKLSKDLGAKVLDELISEMNDYCAASKPKGYLDYAAALRQWARKREKDKTLPGKSAYGRPETVKESIAKRQLADYEKHNDFDACIKTYD